MKLQGKMIWLPAKEEGGGGGSGLKFQSLLKSSKEKGSSGNN